MRNPVVFLEKSGNKEEVKLQEIVNDFINAIRLKKIDTLQKIIADHSRLECQIIKYEIVDKYKFILIVGRSYLNSLSYTDIRIQLKNNISAICYGIIKVSSLMSSTPKYFAIYLEKIDDNWFVTKTEYMHRKNESYY